MINYKKVMAIITARGGSKRLPNKNILPLAGQPLLGWTLSAAKNSKYIDKIFVSTDSPQIADIAASYDISIDELRPSILASDTTSSEDVLSYTIDKFSDHIDIIVLLQPTSPLRTSSHIDEALELFINKKAHTVISVSPCEHSPLWTNTLPVDNSLCNFIQDKNIKRSQELDEYFRINGAIYILDKKNFMETKKIHYSLGSYAYIMPQEDSIDIDNLIDFKLAEVLLNLKTKQC